MLELIERQVKFLLMEKPEVYYHSRGVQALMQEILDLLGLEGQTAIDLLTCSILHDIGKSKRVALTGHHPYDGAEFAREQGYNPNVQRAILLHSCGHALCVEDYPGLKPEYDSALSRMTQTDFQYLELLTFCDMRVDHVGTRVSAEERLHGIYSRYPEDNATHTTFKQNRDYIIALDQKIARNIRDLTDIII